MVVLIPTIASVPAVVTDWTSIATVTSGKIAGIAMLVLMWPGWALIVTRLVLVVSMGWCVDLLVCFDSFYIVWSIWIF